MTSEKEALGSFGTILALLGAIFSLVILLAGIFKFDLAFIPTGPVLDVTFGLQQEIGGIPVWQLVWSLLLLLVTTGKINIGEIILEGIVIILLALMIGNVGGMLALLGGILIVIDAIF